MTPEDSAQILLAAYMHLLATGGPEVPEYLCPPIELRITVAGQDVPPEAVEIEGGQEWFDAVFAGAIRALSCVALHVEDRGIDVDDLLRDALNHLADIEERAT